MNSELYLDKANNRDFIFSISDRIFNDDWSISVSIVGAETRKRYIDYQKRNLIVIHKIKRDGYFTNIDLSLTDLGRIVLDFSKL